MLGAPLRVRNLPAPVVGHRVTSPPAAHLRLNAIRHATILGRGLVEPDDAARGLVGVEALAHAAAGRLAEPARALRIVEQLLDGACESGRLARRHEETGFAV